MKLKKSQVMIDPGHSPGNKNCGKNGYYEYAGMWTLSNYLKDELERRGAYVELTRTKDEDPSLTTRGKSAAGYDLFISEHSNAGGGAARGVEVYYSVDLPQNKEFAAELSKVVSGIMGNADRGAKTRESTNIKGEDYYTVIDSAQDAGAVHVLLIENGFHDNVLDERFLLNEDNLKKIAEAQAGVICKFLNISNLLETPIIGNPSATLSQAQQWARDKGATDVFVGLAEKYWLYAEKHGGINPVLAYCQSALETKYGRFGGVLDESYCNPCGMKTRSGGGDYDTSAHEKFKSWEDGIKAHLDHLALYAGAVGYPRVSTTDPRHFTYIYGTVKTLEGLSGKWASSTTYGNDIKAMMESLENTRAEADTLDVAGALKILTDYGIVSSPDYWINAVKNNELEYLDQLIINTAQTIEQI